MSLIYIIVAICIFFQAERGILDTLSYFRLFRRLKDKSTPTIYAKDSKRLLYILLPVLREKDIIEDTILHFCRLEHPNFVIRIAVITTIRERGAIDENRNVTTGDVIAKSLESGSLSRFKESIHVFEDQNKNGNMATQLNHAIQKLKTAVPSGTHYLVYNADSIITSKTLAELYQLIKDTPEGTAFQQPCAYVRDMQPQAPSFVNALSLYQSWYCLGHESSLIYKYDKISRNSERGTRLGVIVGHGSGMTIDINRRNGGYPEKLLTEDLTFGFILSARSERISLLPAIEIADVPITFSAFVRQKSVWFWNYLGYFSCYKKMRIEGRPLSQLIPLLFQGITAGAYWFSSALFILIPLLLSLIAGYYWLILISLGSTILFCILPQFILLRNLPNILERQGFRQAAQNVRGVSFFKILPHVYLILLTDSLGAWIATYKYLMYYFSGKLPIKYKTGD